MKYQTELSAALGAGYGLATGKQDITLTGQIHGRNAVVRVRHNMETPNLFRFECELEDSEEGAAQWIEHASGNIGATDDIALAADTAWNLCVNYPYHRGHPYVMNREVVTGPLVEAVA